MGKIIEHGVYSGNSYEDTAGQNDHGERKKAWLFGRFMPEGDPRRIDNLEIAFNDHAKGILRKTWAVNDKATTLSILIEGRVCMEFPERDIVLEKSGDYVMWDPGVPHRWKTEDGTKFMSIRWPSLAGDSHDVDSPRKED